MSNDATGIDSVNSELNSREYVDANDSVLDTAVRLKLIRDAFGLSQRELAKRAGVTNSSISMIEQGQVSPSIQSLSRILAAFPLDLADFFSFKIPVVPPVTAIKATETLTLINTYQQLDARIEHLPAGQSTKFGVLGVDCSGVVLNGSLQLTLVGGNLLLSQGDSFYIPANQLHRLVNLSKEEASLFFCSLFVHKG